MTRVRTAPRAALAAVVLAWSLAGCGGDPSEAAGDAPAAALRSDPRVAELLEDCPQRSLYDEDVGQSAVLVARLVDKLEHGQLDPLKRAKEELAAIGAPVLPDLRRMVERNYGQAFLSPIVENALGVATRMEAPGARELLLLGFDHPQETVRTKAVEGLRLRHARPEDFDALVARLAVPESAAMRGNLAQALFQADRARAEALALEWVRTGAERPLWNVVLPEVAATRTPATQATAAELFRAPEDPLQRVWLAAPAAAGGDDQARAYVRERLLEGPWNERLLLADVLGAAGWVEPLVDVLLDDPDVNVLLVAGDKLARAEGWSEARRDALAAHLDAYDPRLRALTLQLLVERGDAAATERALAQLDSDEPEPLQAALLALREPIRADDALLERARSVLAVRNEREAGLPLQDRKRTFKAIAQLPLAWAAETLVDVAREHPGERIERLRAHEWLTIQAGNTGEAGRAQLYAMLAEEVDPLRRLDLIRALSLERSDDARELLLGLVEGGAQTELEVLYAAHRLALVGPSHLVAPRLKRVLYAIEDPVVRRALSCLLWYWY